MRWNSWRAAGCLSLFCVSLQGSFLSASQTETTYLTQDVIDSMEKMKQGTCLLLDGMEDLVQTRLGQELFVPVFGEESLAKALTYLAQAKVAISQVELEEPSAEDIAVMQEVLKAMKVKYIDGNFAQD